MHHLVVHALLWQLQSAEASPITEVALTTYKPLKFSPGMGESEGTGPYECYFDGCNKEYRHYASLYSHIKVAHLKVRSYMCTDCEERFYRETQLDAHRAATHLAPLIKCSWDNCHVEVPTQNALDHHVAFVDKARERSVCPICSRTFKDKKGLRKHQKDFEGTCTKLKAKTPTNKPPEAKCHHCGSSFQFKTSLTKHLKGRCKVLIAEENARKRLASA